MRSPLVWLGALVVSAHAAFWMEDIQHQGIQPFNTDNTYRVFRNVKDFGAKGDGSTDDTDAIQRAMSEGGRCSPFNCNGATVSPAVVYFPSGTYLINSTIVDYFYTMIIGDPNDRPVLKATSSFNGGFMLDGNPYVGPKMAWLAINTFFRQIRNIELDISEKQGDLIALHWPTSQATSIQNAVFRMAPLTSGFQHQGMLIEEGSGGFMSDLEFYGGMYGMNIGNQQFTMRNLKFRGCWTAIHQIWDWTWTYQGLDIADVEYGIYIDHAKTPDGSFANLAAASVIVMDSRFENVPVAVHGSRIFGANDTPPASGSLILNEVEFSNCSVILEDRSNTTVIEGGEESKTVEAFVLGHVYDPINGHRDFQGEESSYFIRPRKLTGADGMAFYTQSKPSYATEAVTSFISARTSGCAGDANTDDTACLNELFALAAAGNKIVFLDAGYYLVTDTVYVPPGSRIVGEALSSVILASGPAFSDIDAPLPVLQVGKQSRRGKSEEGRVELSDMVVSTQGGTAGAIMIEYNLYTSDSTNYSTNYSTGGAPSGMWDVHVRIGGFAGSQLTKAECAITNGTVATPDNIKGECMAAYLSTHITKGAGGLYHENCWLWTADHDIEAPGVDQVTVFAGRGMLIESKRGRVWVLASGSEHHQLYNYQVAGATDVYMGVIQSETPYYQPNPPATLPFPAVAALNDPTFDDCPDQEGDVFGPENPACAMSWGLRVIGDAKNVVVAGAGLYSFFQNNELGCNPSDVPGTGAWCQARMFQAGDFGASGSGPYRNETAGALTVYGYQTVGATSMITRFGEDVEMWDDNIAGFTSGIMVYKHNA